MNRICNNCRKTIGAITIISILSCPLYPGKGKCDYITHDEHIHMEYKIPPRFNLNTVTVAISAAPIEIQNDSIVYRNSQENGYPVLVFDLKE